MGSVTTQILQAAAILTAIGVIGGALWWVIQKVLRPLAIVAEDWRGEPDRPGVPGRPGVMVQLAELRSQVSDVHSTQASDRAAWRALERRVAAMESRLPPLDGQPRLEAGGTGFQAERALEVEDVNDTRVYGFAR